MCRFSSFLSQNLSEIFVVSCGIFVLIIRFLRVYSALKRRFSYGFITKCRKTVFVLCHRDGSNRYRDRSGYCSWHPDVLSNRLV